MVFSLLILLAKADYFAHSQIEKKLALPFPPLSDPSVTPASIPKLATSLEAATAAFSAPGSKAREVFGDAVRFKSYLHPFFLVRC